MLIIKMSNKGGPVFTLSLPGGRLTPLTPVSYATDQKMFLHKKWLKDICAFSPWVVSNFSRSDLFFERPRVVFLRSQGMWPMEQILKKLIIVKI